MKVNHLIDWMRYTAESMSDGSRMVPEHPLFENMHDAKPAPFFEFATTMRVGRMDWCGEKSDQPHMVTFTGQDLIEIRRAGRERAVLRHACALRNVNFTRLDFAVDIHDGFTASDFERRFRAGEMVSKARKMTVIESESLGKSGGKTVYIGSRQSQKMLRVYDKGLQAGTGEKWTRVEFEMKQETATRVAAQMAERGIKHIGLAAIKSFCDAPDWKDWQVALGTAVEIDMKIGRKETNHERWLKSVVFPNFAKAVEDGNPLALDLLQRYANVIQLTQ